MLSRPGSSICIGILKSSRAWGPPRANAWLKILPGTITARVCSAPTNARSNSRIDYSLYSAQTNRRSDPDHAGDRGCPQTISGCEDQPCDLVGRSEERRVGKE